jgi:hypothetical protein
MQWRRAFQAVPQLSEGGKAMKNVLALVAFLVIVVAAVGWYQGWYHIKTVPTTGGHEEITIDVDAPKIGADLGKGRDKITGLVKDAKSKGQTIAAQPQSTTSNTQPAQNQPGQWIPFQGQATQPTNQGPIQPVQYGQPALPQVPPGYSPSLPPAPQYGNQPPAPQPPVSRPSVGIQFETGNGGTIGGTYVLPGNPGNYEGQGQGAPVPPR